MYLEKHERAWLAWLPGREEAGLAAPAAALPSRDMLPSPPPPPPYSGLRLWLWLTMLPLLAPWLIKWAPPRPGDRSDSP